MNTQTVSTWLAAGTIILQAGIVLVIVYSLFFRKKYPALGRWLGKHGLLLAFLTALLATCASLFYSNVAGFTPCDLCWFQRIFMYPLVILLGLAWYKKDSAITPYALLLAGIGFCLSLYHNYLYYNNQGLSVFCNLSVGSVSCVKRYVFEFGYVTIPVMALTAFAGIIALLLFNKIHNK